MNGPSTLLRPRLTVLRWAVVCVFVFGFGFGVHLIAGTARPPKNPWEARRVVSLALNAPADARAEVKVIDRIPVAGGAEVVVEVLRNGEQDTQCWYSYRNASKGVNWLFYKEAATDDKTGYSGGWMEKSRLRNLMSDESRITFWLDQGDAVVVTVALDAAAPTVREDRFGNVPMSSYSTPGFYGMDSLYLPHNGRGSLTLKRDQEGTWLFADVLPYEENLRSRVAVFTPDYKLREEAQIIPFHRLPAASVPETVSIGTDCLPEAMALREWLRCRREVLPAFRPGVGPPAAPPQGWLFCLLPSMGRSMVYHRFWENGLRTTHAAWDRLMFRSVDLTTTAADLHLPCFASDYDRQVREICRSYDQWIGYHESRVVGTLMGLNDREYLWFVASEIHREKPFASGL